MATATVEVVTVLRHNAIIRPIPVAIGRRPSTNVAVDLRNERVLGNEFDGRIEEAVNVAFDKAETHQGCYHLRGVDGFTVVRDAGGFLRERDGQRRVAGCHHAKRIDKDLGADLLSNNLAVARRRAAFRRRNSILQVQKGRVFR